MSPRKIDDNPEVPGGQGLRGLLFVGPCANTEGGFPQIPHPRTSRRWTVSALPPVNATPWLRMDELLVIDEWRVFLERPAFSEIRAEGLGTRHLVPESRIDRTPLTMFRLSPWMGGTFIV